MKLRILLLLLFLIPLGVRAQDAKDGPPCADQATTIDIAECISKDTKIWDKHLNVAYKALGPAVDPEQREPLKVAQRLWVQYRDANGGFYAAHEGTIHQILYADCVWTMTHDRALELEQAAKP